MTRPILILALALCAAKPAASPARADRASGCSARTAPSRSELAPVLRRGRFSGVVDGRTTIRRVGCVSAGRAELAFYHYSRVWGNQRMTQRLIVISSRDGYLGMYAVDDPPARVEGDRVRFPYADSLGDEIRITRGRLPRTVRLNGEVTRLFR